jgi:DNA topoisomerase-1
MEDEMIGTKATRADIVDTLFRRGYLDGRDIEMTDLGFAIVETMSRYSPQILSVEMTRNLERELDSVQSGEVSANAVVENAKDLLGPVLSDFKEKERLIGAEIDEALRREAQRAGFLGPCPVCENGEIKMVRNNETGKRFAGCNNFYNDLCTVSYPLPQRGKILPTGRRCLSCGAPIVRVIRRGRRPWDLCLNPNCPTKRKDGDDGRQV